MRYCLLASALDQLVLRPWCNKMHFIAGIKQILLFWLTIFGWIPLIFMDNRDDRKAMSGMHLRVAVAQVYKDYNYFRLILI